MNPLALPPNRFAALFAMLVAFIGNVEVDRITSVSVRSAGLIHPTAIQTDIPAGPSVNGDRRSDGRGLNCHVGGYALAALKAKIATARGSLLIVGLQNNEFPEVRRFLYHVCSGATVP
jgi:hypothetical protein